MSEIAIVSSRRARLLQMADAGGAGARRALALAGEPTRFLSIQVGITSIGILNGAIGQGAITTGIQLILLLLTVLPANIHAALSGVPLRGAPPTPLVPRIALQVLFIGLVWWAGLARKRARQR